MTPRVVFDCMVFIQAAANRTGPAGACLDRADGGPVELCVSDETIQELEDVVNRRSVWRKFRTLTPSRVDEFLLRVQRIAVRIDPVPEVVALARDPKDAKYLNLAVAAGAELVVSRDNDLLDLMTSADAEATAFRTAHPDIRVLDPVEFLRTLETPADAPPAPDPDEAS